MVRLGTQFQKHLIIPQPVSKRISFGLPINPYVKLKARQTVTIQAQQTHTNVRDSTNVAFGTGQDELEGAFTRSYFQVSIDCSSHSGYDTHSIQTIWLIIKIILQLKRRHHSDTSHLSGYSNHQRQPRLA